MFCYVILVAVVNLGLGFAVAVHLRQRCRPPAAAADPAVPPIDADSTGGPPRRPTTAEKTPAAKAIDCETGTAVIDACSSGGEAGRPRDPEGDLVSAEAESLIDAATPPGQPSPSRQAVDTFQECVAQHRDRLKDVDEELRRCAEQPDARRIETCLSALRESNNGYLEEQQEACDLFRQLHRERQAYRAVSQELEAASEAQKARIEQANGAIEGFEYGRDLREGCRRMMGETNELLRNNDQVSDGLDKARLEIARQENRLVSLDRAERDDRLTGLLSWTGLEGELQKIREDRSYRCRVQCVALVHVDQYEEVAQQWGHCAGERLLLALADDIREELPASSPAGRCSSRDFMLLFPDSAVQMVADAVERFRQVVEASEFTLGEQTIRVTVSCAVLEADTESTVEQLRARAEATLHEATCCGRNRTVIREGGYASPVVPPDLQLETNVVSL